MVLLFVLLLLLLIFPSYFLFENGINPLDSPYNALFGVE